MIRQTARQINTDQDRQISVPPPAEPLRCKKTDRETVEHREQRKRKNSERKEGKKRGKARKREKEKKKEKEQTNSGR